MVISLISAKVTCEYKLDNGRPVPVRVHTIVISTQHSEDITQEEIQVRSPLPLLLQSIVVFIASLPCVLTQKQLLEHVIKPVVPAEYLDDKTVYHLNPSVHTYIHYMHLSSVHILTDLSVRYL